MSEEQNKTQENAPKSDNDQVSNQDSGKTESKNIEKAFENTDRVQLSNHNSVTRGEEGTGLELKINGE